jgi:hypothetical protein
MSLTNKQLLITLYINHINIAEASGSLPQVVQTNSEGRYPCQHKGCSKPFVTRAVLNHHAAVHSVERPFDSTERSCDRKVNTVFKRMAHIDGVHHDDLKCACPLDSCDKRYSTKMLANHHFKRAHLGVEKYSCPLGWLL